MGKASCDLQTTISLILGSCSVLLLLEKADAKFKLHLLEKHRANSQINNIDKRIFLWVVTSTQSGGAQRSLFRVPLWRPCTDCVALYLPWGWRDLLGEQRWWQGPPESMRTVTRAR